MDSKIIMGSLGKRLRTHISDREKKIASLCGRSGNEYDNLADIFRQIELLTAELRDALILCHNEMQALGYRPRELPMPDAPEIDVRTDVKSVRIVMGGMLPYPIKGSAHFLHEQLDAALLGYMRENKLPRPLFIERCAVVFIHHYADNKAIRNMRDYDNAERRCITHVIARHFLKDDSPACYIAMDMLAPGENTFTEIRLLTISDFRALVQSKEIEYFPQSAVSKNS